MGWPSPGDYNGAIQNPQAAFRDPKLKECAVELKRTMPLPWARSGANAIVYRLINGSWSIAVRVFMNAPKAERQSRYQKVHAYLQQTKPKCMVEFGYEPAGILVGQWLPILTMEWVDGQTLGAWFREAVERKDSAAIKQMSHEWIKLVCELRSHKIAHCDLQHGNVMVVGQRLVLVDYDGMFVPTMDTGDDNDRVAWENGLPEYQHPGRIGRLLSSSMDDFSAWVILISLRAVADDLSLWHRTIGSGDGESLLFSVNDIKYPDRSALWPELINGARDRMVREWSAALRKSLDGPFEEIPPFDIDIFGPLREVIRAGDWRQIQALATSRRYASETFPADLAPKVNEAIKRVEHAQQFEEKVRGGRLREIAAAYRPELFDGWLDAALVAKGREAKLAVALFDEFARAEKTDPAGRLLVALWDKRGSELSAMPEAAAIQNKVGLWRKRIAATERLDQIVRKGGSELEILGAWQAAEKAGGHPDAEPHRSRAEQAAKRVTALEALTALSHGTDEASDSELLKTFAANQETLAGCAEAEPFLERARAAKERWQRLKELKRRIDAADHGTGSEQAVIDAADRLAPRYGAGYVDRIAKARERVVSSTALDTALAASPPSDLAIAAAADRARSGGTWPTDASIAARCELAIRRRNLLQSIDAIPSAAPLDERDAQLTRLWDDALLRDCRDARQHRARHDAALARIATIRELEQALERGDAVAVKRLARDPILADHPGVMRRNAEIEALIAKSEQVERLIDAARAGRSEAFLAEAEPGLLFAHAAQFVPYRDQIAAWVDERLRRGDILGKADPMFFPDANQTSVTARWTWAQSRLVRSCLAASDVKRFLARPEDSTQGAINLDPDMHRRNRGGTIFVLPPNCGKLYVTVWPVVDLGWDRRIGPPLAIGPYNATAAGRLPAAALSIQNGRLRWPDRLRTWFEQLLNW
jgi:hypothetical protein